MNTLAVLIGLLFGVLTTAVCYVVSLVTAGLFGRSFYRLYARVLVGICSIMLLAPGLRWIAMFHPGLAAYGLTAAQYVVMGLLCYVVFKFNRDHLKGSYQDRKTATFFAFGTLANAAVVTLVFLHVAITGSPNWGETLQGYVGAGHYGPLVVILAAMIFHTDYHLKQAFGNQRRFSQFTFIGYAVSFVGLALSMVPYFSDALSQLGLTTLEEPLLENFFSAQALLLAIILYGWLVARYDSIPPLFLLLLAIVVEYHVLVTQWFVKFFGPESWGLASLPLFVGLAVLDHFFTNWDRRKHKLVDAANEQEALDHIPLRFGTPFRWVEMGLAVLLFGIALRSRFLDGGADYWLISTFGIYACLFAGMAVARSKPWLIYVSGSLAVLAAMLGMDLMAGPPSMLLLGLLSVTWSAIAMLGERGRLKLEWRTPIVDTALLSAGIITLVIFCRHIFGPDAYHFQAVGLFDGLALVLAATTCSLCALHYRSQVPVFAAVIAVSLIVPPWCSAVGLLATLAASICKRSLKTESAIVLEDRVKLFGVIKVPMPDVLPELFIQPLSMGAIPLAVLGLLISVGHVWEANFSTTVMIGAVTSALVLGWMTRAYRITWLYVLSFIATFFAIHTVAHGFVFQRWPVPQAVAGHLLVASTITLVSWGLATGYAAWCGALLRRVAEEREAGIREQRAYYAGLLYDMSLVAAVFTLGGIFISWISSGETSSLTSTLLFVATAMTTIVFCHAASVYRSQIGAYLSLTAFTLTIANAPTLLYLAGWQMTAVAGAGLLAAVASYLACGRRVPAIAKTNDSMRWKPAIPYLQATGFAIWFRPLGLYAMGCSAVAVLAQLGLKNFQGTIEFGLTFATPFTLAVAGTAYLFTTRAFRLPATYLAGIVLIHASVHALVAVQLDRFGSLTPSRYVHLFTAAGLSLLGCCVAAACASLINTRGKGVEIENKTQWLKNRVYYSGILQHFSFGTALAVLFLLTSALITGDVQEAAWLNLGTSLLLTVAFFAFSFLYYSRIQTYATLTAICLGVVSVVGVIAEEFEFEYWPLSITAAGLLFALVGWMLQRSGKTWQFDLNEYGGRRFDCWEKPPWKWVALENSLWAVPLAQFAVLLASLAVALVGYAGFTTEILHSKWWLAVTPTYLAAATFFVATRVQGVGLLDPLIGPFTSTETDLQKTWTAERREQGINYVISLILLVSGIHLTVHLKLVRTMPEQLAVSWHLLVGAVLVLLGWVIASLIVKHFAARIVDEPDRVDLRAENAIYGGLLHHVSAFGAVLFFVLACTLGVPPNDVSIPALAGLGLLIVFFTLASITYRAQAACYLGLLSAGLATLHLASMGSLASPALAPLEPPAIALLGLGLMVLARFAAIREQSKTETAEENSPTMRSWLEPVSLDLNPRKWRSLSRTWMRPLRESAILYAAIGLAVMLLYRWVWNETWNVANGQAVVTYSCVAITFALGAHQYNSAVFSYAAAVVVAFSVVPQMLIAGVPIAHLGIGLAALAILFWGTGYFCERICIGRKNSGDDSSARLLETIYERPLIRCSAIVALVAIAHSMFAWKTYGWTISQTPIVFACFLGAVTLLLNARSLDLLHRVTRARLLVYLACACLTGCALTVTSAAASFDGLGPVSAITALVLGVAALALIEHARAVADSNPDLAKSRRTFAEPMSHFACGLSLLAVMVSLIAAIGSFGAPLTWLDMPPWLGTPPDQLTISQIPILPAAFTWLIASVVCLLTVRAERDERWLYPFVILASTGLLLLAESQFDWSLGTLVIVSLALMNLLVLLARLVRVGDQRVESLLGLSESKCELPFFQWPLVFTMGLLLMQGVLAIYSLFDASEFSRHWPWIWSSLLVGGLFLHVLYLEKQSAYVHLLVWSAVIGAVGFCTAGDAMLSRDELVVAVGFGWGAMALGFLFVGQAGGQAGGHDGEQEVARPLFSGAGNSALTLTYLFGSALAIAPVVISSQALSVGISLGVISLCWLWMAWVSGEEVLGYATVLGFFATMLYVGHDVLGTSLVGNPLTAYFVLGYSFLIYGVNILVSRSGDSKAQVLLRPTYYLALLLPLSLVVAIPMDQRGPAAFALLGAGAFYLLVARQSQVRWALYVAAGCANVAIYLWIPAAREATGLFQLYVIPAAITVLVFAQLHRQDLNAQVLTSIRLAAAGLILAVSTFEVFFTEDSGLLQFVVVLVISLVGTAAGIALRIKPFVYGGVAFLIINVLGQLGIQFQHQGGVTRAVILIGLGLMILAMMIFFNVHRERVLSTYRGFVSDKSWE